MRLTRLQWRFLIILGVGFLTYLILAALLVGFMYHGLIAEDSYRPCIIPELNPWDPTVMQTVTNTEPESCGRKPLFGQRDNRLVFNRDVLEDYGVSKLDEYTCFYQELYRTKTDAKYSSNSDDQIEYSDLLMPIQQNLILIDTEFIRITCHFSNFTVFYKDFLIFVPRKVHVEKRIHDTPVYKGVSILVLGVESVSRQQLTYQMPNTFQVLQEMGAIGLNGFNSISEDKFANLVPLLSGLSQDELTSECWRVPWEKFDDCPLIWKHMERAGYRTVYGEEELSKGVFNPHRGGFWVQPTDYYLRTVGLAMEEEFNSQWDLNPLCYGPRLSLEVTLNYVHDVATTFDHDKYFLYVWTSSMSAENLVTSADSMYSDLLRRLQVSKALDNTALIFLSDQGFPNEITDEGWLEARFPFCYLVLPESFKKSHPHAVHTLRLNSERLTTNYDLHETLLDLSDPSLLDLKYVSRRTHYRGISLFLPVPESRSCHQAQIELSSCGCLYSKEASKDDMSVQMSAKSVVGHLNLMIAGYHRCKELKLAEIVEALEVKPVDRNIGGDGMGRYDLVVKVEPGGALVRARVTREDRMVEVRRVDGIARTNRCVDDDEINQFCFCE